MAPPPLLSRMLLPPIAVGGLLPLSAYLPRVMNRLKGIVGGAADESYSKSEQLGGGGGGRVPKGEAAVWPWWLWWPWRPRVPT